MILTVLALAILLTGLSLIVAGIVVLLKSNNKLAGLVVLGVGIVFLLVPVLLTVSRMFAGTTTG